MPSPRARQATKTKFQESAVDCASLCQAAPPRGHLDHSAWPVGMRCQRPRNSTGRNFGVRRNHWPPLADSRSPSCAWSAARHSGAVISRWGWVMDGCCIHMGHLTKAMGGARALCPVCLASLWCSPAVVVQWQYYKYRNPAAIANTSLTPLLLPPPTFRLTAFSGYQSYSLGSSGI